MKKRQGKKEDVTTSSGERTEWKVLVERGKTPNVRFLARAWNIPKTILQRHISEKVTGLKPFLSVESEKELASLSERGFPLTKRDIQGVAFDCAKVNNTKGFSEEKGTAGCDWFKNFLKQNPDFSIRKPEALSAARAAGLNPEVVGKWFQEYEDLLEELTIKDVPSHVWNCDESGLQHQFCSRRVVGEVGKPCVEITVGEKERPPQSLEPST